MRLAQRRHLLAGTAIGLAACLIMVLALSACGSGDDAKPAADTNEQSKKAKAIASGEGAQKLLDPEVREIALLQALQQQPSWIGDFDAMVDRRVIRVLLSPNRTNYFLDGAVQRGVTYDAMVAFEKFVNKHHARGRPKVHIVLLPVSRDLLIPALLNGLGDLVAANMTITDLRRKQVSFSKPLLTGVRELVVTGPAGPDVSSLDDLSGREVWVRPNSSYHESLVNLNKRLKSEGKKPVVIRDADPHLETEDLLEMVNAGIIGITISDSHLADFWDQIFDDVTVHEDLAIRTGGKIAWLFRKNSPQLEKEVNAFISTMKEGTLMGNMLFKKYLKSTKWVHNATSGRDLKRYKATVDFFKKYSKEYDFDYLMMVAQGYQESRLDQHVRSSAGAIGIMQLLPSTAADPAIGIKDIRKAEPNVHAGIKYMRWIVDNYFKDENLDPVQQTLFAFASYNAGPTRIQDLRRKAKKRGLDPDVWFDNVEIIAAEEIGQETVRYVSNIYKYYLAYTLLANQQARREHAIEMTEEEK